MNSLPAGEYASGLVVNHGRPGVELIPNTPVFGLSARQIGRRVQASEMGSPVTAAESEWPRDLAASGVELPALMNAGRWKSYGPARYTKRQAVGRGAVARYSQERGG